MVHDLPFPFSLHCHYSNIMNIFANFQRFHVQSFQSDWCTWTSVYTIFSNNTQYPNVSYTAFLCHNWSSTSTFVSIFKKKTNSRLMHPLPLTFPLILLPLIPLATAHQGHTTSGGLDLIGLSREETHCQEDHKEIGRLILYNKGTYILKILISKFLCVVFAKAPTLGALSLRWTIVQLANKKAVLLWQPWLRRVKYTT